MAKVKLSVNTKLENCMVLKELGFPYIEPSNTDLMRMTPKGFADHAALLEKSGMKCHVIDNPIPCSVSFSDENWRIDEWSAYLTISAKRARRLGAKYWCFGNGGSRQLKERRDFVMTNFYEAVDVCAEIGGKYGVQVIVEPLGPSVTDYLLNVAETVCFLEELGRNDVYTMVDYRWELEQGRPIADLYRHAGRIRHAHIDSPATDYKNEKVRRVQKLGDGADYTAFLDFIKSADFDGILSIEANCFSDFAADLADAMAFYTAHEITPCV